MVDSSFDFFGMFSDRVKDLSGSAIRKTFKILSRPGIISFAGGMPDSSMFPLDKLKTVASDIISEKGQTAFQYGVTEGFAPLIEQTKKMLMSQNIAKYSDNIIIVSGGQQGISLASKILINDNDLVVCENPSFIGALNSFRSFNARIIGVDMEDDGINICKLESLLKREKVKLVYTIPTFQNPTGISMSLEKRKALVSLAEKYKFLIIEDNPYGDLRYKGESLPTLRELGGDLVIYVGSFSKILSPGIRVGFVIAEPSLTEKMVVCKQVEDVHTSVLPQMMVSEFLDRYSIKDHISSMCNVYEKRLNCMRNAIKEYFPAFYNFTSPEGGLFIWCSCNDSESIDSERLYSMALEKNIAFVPGRSLMVNEESFSSSFRLNFSSSSEDVINKGIKILGDVIRAYS